MIGIALRLLLIAGVAYLTFETAERLMMIYYGMRRGYYKIARDFLRPGRGYLAGRDSVETFGLNVIILMAIAVVVMFVVLLDAYERVAAGVLAAGFLFLDYSAQRRKQK